MLLGHTSSGLKVPEGIRDHLCPRELTTSETGPSSMPDTLNTQRLHVSDCPIRQARDALARMPQLTDEEKEAALGWLDGILMEAF